MEDEWRYINGSKLSLWQKIKYLAGFFYLECILLTTLYLVTYIAVHSADPRWRMETFAAFLASYVVPHSESFSHFAFFATGFYQLLTTKRWWDQYTNLPWPDNMAIRLTGTFYKLII